MEISVSILNSEDKKKIIKELNNSTINYYHLDIMDGNFVSQKSLSLEEISEIIPISNKELDVHLMVSNPTEYIEYLGKIKLVTYITIHLEIDKEILNLIKKIKSYHKKVGISIKPNTDTNLLKPYLKYIDLILVMTVEPGLGGQAFLENSPSRLHQIKQLITGYDIQLEVDGGINNQTIKLVQEADIAVVGSYITTSDNPIMQISKLSA